MPSPLPTSAPGLRTGRRRVPLKLAAALLFVLGALVIALAGAGLAGAQSVPPTTPTTPPAPTTTMAAPTTTRAPVVTTRAPVVTTAAPRNTVASTAFVTTSAQPITTVAPSTTVATVEAPATSAPALLVAGPNDTSQVATTDASSAGLSSGTKLKLVIAGLIAVAIAIAALTIAYWRHTRPYEWEQYEEPIDDESTPTEAADPGEPTQAVPAPVAAALPVREAGPPVPPNGTSSNGGSGASASQPVTTSSGPVVPSLIPADVLAPQIAIITLEDLERGSDTGDGAAAPDAGPEPGPATAPMSSIDDESPPA